MITSDSKIASGGDTFSEIVAVNEVHLKQLQKLIGRMEEYFSIHNKEKFDLLSCKHKLNDTYSNSLVWSFTDEKFLVYDGGELIFDSKPENSNQLTIKLMDGDNYIISDELFFWNVKREVAITLEELKTLCFKIMNISSLTDEETRELFLEYIENVVNTTNIHANKWSMFSKMVNEPLLKYLLVRMTQILPGFASAECFRPYHSNLTKTLYNLEQVRKGEVE